MPVANATQIATGVHDSADRDPLRTERSKDSPGGHLGTGTPRTDRSEMKQPVKVFAPRPGADAEPARDSEAIFSRNSSLGTTCRWACEPDSHVDPHAVLTRYVHRRLKLAILA